MRQLILSLGIMLPVSTVVLAEEALSPVVVTADLRETSAQEIPASVSVVDELTLEDEGATHFEDVLFTLPNVNYSGQSSRPRHIQIRGIGERDEYTGAPNPSVGFSIDDIDFSGIGMTGSLFDVKQVEVLRGPQGTRFGANALGGLINIRSNDPSKTPEHLLEASLGEDELRELGLVTSGPITNTGSVLYRLSVLKHDDNGFRKNLTLNRDDTNGRDELTARGKLRFTPNETTQVDLTLLHADLDNGYDAWSLDNTRTTLSDQPGQDTQLSDAGAAKIRWDGSSNYTLTATTTLSDSDMTYSYDGDWVYVGYHPDEYIYFYRNDKTRQTVSQELRWVSKPAARLFAGSTDWLFGVYGLDMREKNHTSDNYGTDKKTDYDAVNLAAFGQLDYHLDAATQLSIGLRFENRSADFKNNHGEKYTPSDDMLGGHLTLSHFYGENFMVYAGITQGYKAGGFNADLPADADPKLTQFDIETATNYELGFKSESFDGRMHATLTVFYMDRNNPQFDGYTYVGVNYVFFTENFDRAINYGLESELNWQATERVDLFATVGLLRTRVEGESITGAFRIDGREQPHAPKYQYTLGTQYRNDHGLFSRIALRGVDSFYFSNAHTQKSNPYTVLDARIGYEADTWEVYLWGKNLTDEDYATRGFYFGNDPAKGYVEETYVKLADPRSVGVTARYRF